MDCTLTAVNKALLHIPMNGKYALAVEISGLHFVCKRAESGSLRIEQSSGPPGSTDVRTWVYVDSADTLKKLARGSETAALSLLASKRLRVEGEMSQLRSLRAELQPHKSELLAAVTGALPTNASALISADKAPWVPNDAAPTCMEPTCGSVFCVFRRRHHCRACGGVFCKNCAPRSVFTSGRMRPERACIACRRAFFNQDGSRRALVAESAERPSSRDGAQKADVPGTHDAADFLLDWHVEQQLRQLRLTARLVFFSALALSLTCCCYRSDYLYWFVDTLSTLPWTLHALPCVSVGLLMYSWATVWRLLRVTWVVSVLVCSVFWTSYIVRGCSVKGAAATMEIAHRVHARFLLEAVMSLSGFYVKVAQSLAIETAIPEPFHAELSKLHDSMPAAPISEVEVTLAEEFGADWKRLIQVHTGPPLGSATIAQVHRATLLIVGEDGEERTVEGVIKVQHPKMKGNLAADMHAAQLIGSALGTVSPDLFDNMGDIIRNIAVLTMNELDFRTEAENQRLAREAAKSAGINIVIPEVYGSLVTRRVMAMEYVDGVSLSDFPKDASEDDRFNTVRNLIEFFAFSFTQAGIFNCDPHPGNLLVRKQDSKLVVLDWGQAQRLLKTEMEAYSLLFVAAALENPFLLTKVGKMIGAEYSERQAVSMVSGLRFLMRDSCPLDMSKEEILQLEKMFAGLAEVPELNFVKGDAKGILRGPLLPLSKTVNLLHNVSSRLGVSLCLLQMFAERGYKLVLENACAVNRIPVPEVRTSKVGFVLQPAIPKSLTCNGGLSERILHILSDAHGQGHVIGAQLVVLDANDGNVLSDLSFGHDCYLSGRNVTPDVPFNIAEISKLILSLATLRLAERGSVDLTAKMQDVWPTAKGLHNVTLEQILSHTAGVSYLFPDGVNDMAALSDLGTMLPLVENSAAPVIPPGVQQRYHHFSWGWLLAGALRGFGQESVPSLPASDLRIAMNRASVQKIFGQGQTVDLSRAMDSSSVEEMGELFEEVFAMLNTLKRASCEDATLDEKGAAECIKSVQGRVHWLHPFAYKQSSFANGFLPGTVAYSTARDLAKLLLRVERGEVLGESMLQSMKKPRKPQGDGKRKLGKHFHHFSDSEWGLGAELIRIPGVEKSLSNQCAWGHTSASGSFAAVIPGKKPVVAVLLLNRYFSWRDGLPNEIFKAVAEFSAKGCA